MGTPQRPPARKPSLRSELLINLAVLAAGALALAVTSALLAPLFTSSSTGAAALAGLVAVDLLVFILFGRYLIARLITRPIDELVTATEAVAAGELARRGPRAAPPERGRLGGRG